MQKEPESLTFERFSELITGANRDNSPSIYLSKDLSVVTESLLMARVMPVSYTHLDVYKRQILYSLVMTAVWLSVAVKRVLS